MEVTIIFEDLNLFAQEKAVAKPKSIRKSLRLSITKRVLVYALALIVGIALISVNFAVLGLVIISVSSALFYIIEFFKKAFYVEINFSNADSLDNMLQEDLYD